MKAWKVILAALVIFLAGAAAGGLTASKLYHRQALVGPARLPMAPRPGWRQASEFLRRLDRQLKLTPDQHQRIELILRESQERMKKVWEPISAQAQEEFRHTRERIRAELNPEQRQKLDESTSQYNQRKMEDSSFRDKRDHRRPPPQFPGFSERSSNQPAQSFSTNHALPSPEKP